MNIVDSCGWLEYFSNGSNAEKFAEPIQETAELIKLQCGLRMMTLPGFPV